MKKLLIAGLSLCFLLLGPDMNAQRKKRSDNEQENEKSLPLGAFKMRNIGPAFLSGRIADIVFHPENDNIWYVAVGSGGVWKTENAGTTWTPLFDSQSSYSTGCITLDPSNPEIVWVGTGENVGGRHVGFGDGIYRSADGGKTWKNMGLKNSEHISEIIVHPDNSDVVWVAVQGPLWSKGGERGVYKTSDGGETWTQVLGDNEWTGATDLILDPRDPQLLYAATWDRHRTVAAYMGGGPGSGIHKSTDGGNTWTALTNGLPKSNLGKIGIAQSPQQPDVLYAAVELDLKKGAVYRSEDRGASWKKMSNTVSGGTGPHYYQELYASPHKFDRLYLMDVRVQTSEDGGKTFTQLKEADKHSDNHAIVFKKDEPDYIMLGTDAGIYESFDLAEHWRYIKNLPLTQFYKVAVNNAEPFYHIFGGTQDNGSAGGPVATDEREGIANKHWYKTLFADGHQSATDPVYNNIIYAETQQGGLHRVDLTTGEQVAIQPQPRPGEPHERFNWDAPILVSPHDPARIYFASYRVWKSENRGDSWTPISEDLTRNEERFALPIMGRQQSFENPWEVNAMSEYNTITSLSESPVKEGLIYAGTDDGFIQVTEDGGQNWRSIPVTRLGIPGRSFVNDIKADLFDENTVYVALDNHKEGDFSPYLFKSTDKGKTWTSMVANLPERTLVWRMVQDHVKKDLFFTATEFGIYTSLDGGGHWQKLGGTPNMAFRDLVIQKRENDLVAASFGRGFFVLDNYSPLRDMTPDNLKAEGKLFAPRTAKWYVPRSNVGNTGADYYFAPNPDFGAVFTYHLSGDYTSSKSERKKAEKDLDKENKDVPFPGWDALDQERTETDPMVWVTIKDAQGNIIKHIKKSASKGSHRLAWDLTHANALPIDPDSNRESGRWQRGAMVTPGTYSASLYLENAGKVTLLDGPVSFEVKPIYQGVLQGVDYDTYNAFRKQYHEVQGASIALQNEFNDAKNLLKAYRASAANSDLEPGALASQFAEADNMIYAIERRAEGSASKNEVGERTAPGIGTHMGVARDGLRTTYGPTELHQQHLNYAEEELTALKAEVETLSTETLPAIEAVLKAANAPVILKN
ncbi:WD40/YVTN/BNR-like repeat-containing protein [Robertkochia flava]|uniref:WD40/YVTN/BNR-like repeat-containing protein n=1 Tax=Robertkochia flava TaxID=3447986 RepID=UPI001CCE7013|nr:sialidase family protein [Robertkochia marina]